ncbi:dephospho-CoA kinase [Legionella israelensis]|uniref:Dephospho-CoA kinase n=1 Tax=Legionella israelensis TaxID=454 RepID=A0A0W0VN44_9GAMM|nr:dephospho-CoA kinase [Legionella israelensis]KTD21464.1 dephospho-CoA kinase [Legionella israelensis]SCY16098.1 dephospho-CoA kinase [Legionella israelensis DSM 19235]STX58099.1 dephospho-CoA kinase [Legionella israelensis]
MLCIGLTGNIATGKSTVSEEFKKYGAKIINADSIARKLTEKGTAAYHEIIKHFNEDIVKKDGELDRKKLREIIFSQPEEKKWLENLLHPLIRQHIQKEIISTQNDYIIIEIPLYFKREDYPYIDRVLLVTAPESLQIERIMQRDQCSKEEAMATINHQPDLKKRLSIADDVICNDGNLSTLKQRIDELNRKYQHYIN